jgi:hypothetical protein
MLVSLQKNFNSQVNGKKLIIFQPFVKGTFRATSIGESLKLSETGNISFLLI